MRAALGRPPNQSRASRSQEPHEGDDAEDRARRERRRAGATARTMPGDPGPRPALGDPRGDEEVGDAECGEDRRRE
ncbi:MAG: hypothetical protein MZV49_00040 [Rhodopseudomonas palustris]|nr:hypothetical protein [Rhodopseudomonas palustris]